jgi:hypothetical protein
MTKSREGTKIVFEGVNHGSHVASSFWEKFEEGPPEPLEASFNGGTIWERAGRAPTSIQTDEEPIEVNSVV